MSNSSSGAVLSTAARNSSSCCSDRHPTVEAATPELDGPACLQTLRNRGDGEWGYDQVAVDMRVTKPSTLSLVRAW